MAAATISEDEFIRLFEDLGAAKLSSTIGVSQRAIHSRRRSIEGRTGRPLTAPVHQLEQYSNRITTDVADGIVLIGSDCHYWPGAPSTAHRAFVQFCSKMKPAIVILNGDVIDVATISRHPPIGWENRPTVQQEIEVAQDRLAEVVAASGKARRIWTLGNHDARFETRLATVAPEFAKVAGVHLRDHFPLWEPCWSTWINGNAVVKHRFRGGIHAVHNNTLWSGKSIITGHLHSAKVTPFSDYNGTRYGVDTGCIADPSHRAFVDYTEDNPKNWRSAFCILTFRAGRLMQPELVLVVDVDHVEFRGEIIKV